MSESFVSRLMARYQAEGDAAFETRSRRPRTSPIGTAPAVVELIVNLRRDLSDRGLDAGPATIAWHLAAHHQVTVSVSTIRRRLVAAGLITPEPKKRPKSSYVRFEADLPNEMWQSDFTHWRLADGTDVDIIAWLDDHSRYVLSLTAWAHVTGAIVVDTFTDAGAEQRFPAAVLTDNWLVYTTRFAGGRGGRNGLETTLAALGIEHRHSRPSHPTTCGKVERFHQTLKRWLAKQPPAETLAELQTQLDAFVDEYNHRRPHSSLGGRTPAVVYGLLPKAGPATATATGQLRVRHDRIDKTGSVTLRHAGRLHYIGVGRAHATTPVVLIIDDLQVRIVAATTGELIRHLTLDPTRNYQPHQK